jgi:hypothetical protein
MTTQTIPEYLEEERQKTAATQLRTEKEAARIEPLRHGHHRTAKQSNLELVPPFKAATKRKEKDRRRWLAGGHAPRGKEGNENSQEGLTRITLLQATNEAAVQI